MEEWSYKSMSEDERLRLKRNIEKVVSDILSDRYDCDITVRHDKRRDIKDEE